MTIEGRVEVQMERGGKWHTLTYHGVEGLFTLISDNRDAIQMGVHLKIDSNTIEQGELQLYGDPSDIESDLAQMVRGESTELLMRQNREMSKQLTAMIDQTDRLQEGFKRAEELAKSLAQLGYVNLVEQITRGHLHEGDLPVPDDDDDRGLA